MITSYRTDHKVIIDYLRIEGWEDDVIQKYLDYLDKISTKKFLARRGKTAHSDSQMSKVYKAEWWFRSRNAAEFEQFGDIKDVHRYVRKVVKSAVWKKIFDRVMRSTGDVVTVECRNFRGRTAGNCDWDGHITLDKKTGMNEYVLLHEMVHAAGHMHHDAAFVESLLKLISAFMGPAKAKELKKLFKRHRVKVKVPTIAAKNPEAWLVMYERLVKARKVKGV